MTPKLKRIRRGLYQIAGIVCGGDEVYGPCGGALFVERHASGRVLFGSSCTFRWETYCDKCLTCDCNGHPTLGDCLAAAAAYFAAVAESAATLERP